MACKNNKKKGQAALEFLTTYGWAFMVILVMIGALSYFGVLNPRNLIPDSCSISSGFTCEEFQLDTDKISFSIINSMGKPININKTSMNVTRMGDGISSDCTLDSIVGNDGWDESNRVNDGSRFYMSCDLTESFESGDKEKLGFSFDYRNHGGEFWNIVSGTVTATSR